MKKQLLWREVCGTCESWELSKQNVTNATAMQQQEEEDQPEEETFGYCINNYSEFFKLYLSYPHYKCPEYERKMRLNFKKDQ